jgi:[ribosomal protein S5]-alanine N-acetyltransferase
MITDLLKNLPDLQTPRLLLRKLRMEDAADMFEYAQDAEIAASGLWLPYTKLQQSADDIAADLKAYEVGTALDWAVEHGADRKMIGRINLGDYHRRDQRADLGYAYNRRYWGQGYATEAARAVLAFAFGSLGLNRVGAVVLPDNLGSITVLTRLGFQQEGVQRQFTQLRGRPEDLLCFSLLRAEWQP